MQNKLWKANWSYTAGAGWSDKHQRIKRAEPNKGAGWKKSQK